MDKTVDEIEDDIVNYYGGSELVGYSDSQLQIIASGEREWRVIPCDSEGPSPEQEKTMDDLIHRIALEVLAEVRRGNITSDENGLKIEMGLEKWIEAAKSITARYAKNHKGRNNLEKECIRKGYLVRKVGEMFPDVADDQKDITGVFALEYDITSHKGMFAWVR